MLSLTFLWCKNSAPRQIKFNMRVDFLSLDLLHEFYCNLFPYDYIEENRSK